MNPNSLNVRFESDSPKPWLASYAAGVPATLEYPAEPAWGLLRRAARDFPDRPAYRYYEESATYAEVWDQSLRIAAMLRQRGLQPGDRVALLLPNVPEYLVALHGIWLAGGVAVAVSPLMVAEEVVCLLDKTACRFVVALDMLAPLVQDGNCEHVFLVTLRDRLPRWQQLGYVLLRWRKTGHLWFAESDHVSWLDDELQNIAEVGRVFDSSEYGQVVDSAREIHLDASAYILPTGGTTSAPKAVTLSHRNLVANAWQQFHWAGARRGDDTLLAVLPFFHSYGLSATLMTGMAMAGTLIMHHHFSSRLVLQLIERHRPSIFHAVPAMLVALNERLRQKASDLSSIRWCISGGSSLDPAVAAEFAEHSAAVVVEGYGLSEASPVTHVGPLDGSNRSGTIGFPLPDTDARIVDSQTGSETLPPGAVGELVVRGPQVMLGYWDDPEATALAIRDGWLFTGDLAMRDEQGFFKIVDRKKDLIITSGFNVYPADVEALLRQHPAVADAAVVGIPDERRGQAVKALIVLRDGHTYDASSMDHFCREHLAAQKRPRHFEVVTDLPRNFLGKVLRRHLRDGTHEPESLATTDVETAGST